MTAAAEQPYTATSGDTTLTVTAWSTTFVPTAVSEWRPVTISGTWITACGPSIKGVIITYRDGPDVRRTVESFDYINQARCGNILSRVGRSVIIGVSVVTATVEFTPAN